MVAGKLELVPGRVQSPRHREKEMRAGDPYRHTFIPHNIYTQTHTYIHLFLAPAKYDLVHLTRKPKKVNLTATVRLGTVSIQPDPAIRVLGL